MSPISREPGATGSQGFQTLGFTVALLYIILIEKSSQILLMFIHDQHMSYGLGSLTSPYGFHYLHLSKLLPTQCPTVVRPTQTLAISAQPVTVRSCAPGFDVAEAYVTTNSKLLHRRLCRQRNVSYSNTNTVTATVAELYHNIRSNITVTCYC